MSIKTYDLIVLGGGRASNLAFAAAKEGWKVALIEKDRLGGTCPNRGCVPSKLLIGFADAARHVRQAGEHFVNADFRGVDLKKVFSSVNEYVSGVDGRYQDRAVAAGAEVIRGEGKFVGERKIDVNGQVLTAEKILISTGSRPAHTPHADLPVWTSDNLFPLTADPPASLMVIGGGVIGCEMASFFSAVGVETSIFAKTGRLLGKEDTDIEAVFRKEFGKSVSTNLNSELTALTHENGEFTATFRTDEGKRTHKAERVLFAIGRIPNSDALDLEKTGLSPDKKGFVPVNEHLETSVPGIYAAGDVNGRYMLQHAAAREVLFLREKFLKNKPGTIDEWPVGHGVFAHPELAAVGKTEDELKNGGVAHVAVCEDWLASARVEAMRIEYPRVKLLVSPEDHSILGCHMVGPEASTMLHQVITVMQLKNDVRELADTIYIHPAMNECLLAAAVSAVRKVKEYSKG